MSDRPCLVLVERGETGKEYLYTYFILSIRGVLLQRVEFQNEI